MEHKILEDSNCGAVLSDTWIALGKGQQKKVIDIEERDHLLAAQEVHRKVHEVWKRRETTYYIVETANGRYLKVTGQQCLLTKLGWKRVRRLDIGEELMCYDFPNGRVYERLASIRKVEGNPIWVYVIAFENRTFIANGFVCSDYDMEYGEQRLQRRNGYVCK